MATLQYSVILLFMIMMIFLHSSAKIHVAMEGHFQTLHVGSLLPASDCHRSSTVKSGSNKRQSTVLELFHKHGPCSSSTSARPPLADILSSDQSRVESIRVRLEHDSNTNQLKNRTPYYKNNKSFKDAKTNLPVPPIFDSGDYMVTIGLGTPQRNLSLILDTGSGLTWTQCEPCIRSCYKQNETIFDPSASSSIEYGDSSFSIGDYSKDKLTLTQDVLPDFHFGCGQNNQGTFELQAAAGLIGLSRDDYSIVSQTAKKYGKYFSYCLPSVSSSTGHLTFGRRNADSHKNVRFTPFVGLRPDSSFYFIEIEYISVGGQRLQIDPSVFTTEGTIIDSGTVITRLPNEAYVRMRDEFKSHMKNFSSAGAHSILDTCYNYSKDHEMKIPTISFTFRDNVTVDLDASGTLINVDSTTACLAFAGNRGGSGMSIFGNTQQKTLEVVYDVAGGKLGFGRRGCM
ncbi:hypothetical protein OROMI_001508 [Orobanche minor]